MTRAVGGRHDGRDPRRRGCAGGATAPHRSLARDRARLLAAAHRGVLPVSNASGARQPDPDHRPLRAVARPDPGLCRHRLARPCRFLRGWRLRGRAACGAWLGRAAVRPRRRRRGRRARGLCDELPRGARNRPRPVDGHARHRPHAVRGGEPGFLHHRRGGRPVGREDVEASRSLLVRHGRYYRLSLQSRRPVPVVRILAPPRQLAVRPLVARGAREREADAGDRRAGHAPADRHLHRERRHGGRRGRTARANDAVRRARRVRLSALGRPHDHGRPGRRRPTLRRRDRHDGVHDRASLPVRLEPDLLAVLARAAAWSSSCCSLAAASWARSKRCAIAPEARGRERWPHERCKREGSLDDDCRAAHRRAIETVRRVQGEHRCLALAPTWGPPCPHRPQRCRQDDAHQSLDRRVRPERRRSIPGWRAHHRPARSTSASSAA